MDILNKDIRKRILEKAYKDDFGHPGSALSCLDSIKYLYDHVLRENDTFILSKGHAGMALYAVLESKGFSPKWAEHPSLDEKQGIYATTGSLGHGIPIGLGRAFAKKLKGDNGRVYVLEGDGGIQEGSNWEALLLARKFKVNLNVLIDWNKYQSIGSLDEVMGLDDKDLTCMLSSFGCNTITIDGHTNEGLSRLENLGDGLNAVILDTIKGKGVAYLEKTHDHKFNFKSHPQEYKKALIDLE